MDIDFKSAEINSILSLISSESKDRQVIESYKKEFEELDRKQRTQQVGHIQKDKIIGKGESLKHVTAVRVPVAFANKIVNTSVAFEFGLPVNRVPSEENALVDQLNLDWKNSRLDHKIQKAKRIQKQETQSALLFYFKDLKPNNIINRVIGVNKNRAISCRVLDYDSGEFFPYFDETGDMVFFIHRFQTREIIDLKEVTVNHIWIYDESAVSKLKDDGIGGSYGFDKQEAHGFGKIPVVYMSQEKPEHYLVKDAIDRIEVAISKLGNSNDYSGHPILFIQGEVAGLPDKNADGKVMKTAIEFDEDTQKEKPRGDAKFLTHDNAPKSVQLELEYLEKYIYAMSSTPDISFANLKSVGNISEATLELMFLDCTLKKLMNEGQNRTDVERCISVMISGITTTSQKSLASLIPKTVFDIEFPSVLPNNFKENAETLAVAVNAGIMSKETAIELLGKAEDIEEELEKIRLESIELDLNPEPQPQE